MPPTKRYRAEAPDLFDVGERGADPTLPEPQVAARARASDGWFLIDAPRMTGALAPEQRRSRRMATASPASSCRPSGEGYTSPPSHGTPRV